jgi:predicted TPR repeat methyltransferase
MTDASNERFKDCNYEIQFPNSTSQLDQDEEWFILSNGKEKRKVRLHDYKTLYEIPNLYEEVLYHQLKCKSPSVVCGILKEEMGNNGKEFSSFRALDFGAGNGIVGEQLQKSIGCEELVGVDIIPEARDAAQRDRPDTYDGYYVMDLSHPSEKEKEKLQEWKFNVLVTVAALGFNDISACAFVNAFNLIESGSWVAFNIKEKFLSKEDNSGFKETILEMMRDSIEVVNNKRYCHRLSINGSPIYYKVIVARKKDHFHLCTEE